MSDIDTAAIREAFEGNRNRTLRLSDELLASIIQRAGKTWDEFTDNDDEEGACVFLEKAEETAAQVSVTDPGIQALVSKLDDEFYAALGAGVDAAAAVKVSAVRVYAQFRRLFDADTMNALPWPGTEEQHVAGTNHRPDKVKTIDKSTKKPITTVWTNDFVSTMPKGKEYEGTLDDCAKELKARGSIPRFKGKNREDILAIQSDASTRRNSMRNIVKRALSLHHQWVAVTTKLDDKVGIRWIKGRSKETGISMPTTLGLRDASEYQLVSGDAKCLTMYDKTEPTQGDSFSVTQFINFDVDEALAKGGTLEELIATAGRGVGETEADDAGDGEDMPEDVAMATFSQLVNYLNKRENMANVLRIMTDKKHPEHNDWLENMGDLYSLIYPMMRKTRSQYEALKETKLEGFETKAA